MIGLSDRLRRFSFLTATLLTAMLLSSCSQRGQSVSNFPMLSAAVGKGPWQVVTYDDEAVMRDTSALDGDQIVSRSEPVYINNESKFIYRDGSPVKSFSGDNLYWNEQGYIINRHLHVIPEESVFALNNQPLPNGTPLKLRGYNRPTGFASLEPANTLKAF